MKSIEEVIEHFRGFASSSKKKLQEKIEVAVKPFREEVEELITEILEGEILPYVENYLLRKYNEEDFHRKVDQNFDLVRDLYENHYDVYMKYLRRARKIRSFINWDNEKFCKIFVKVLEERGFTIREKDVQWLMRNIEALRREIYS